ncbi:MAG: efflux RND transporter periplasmic adaptor subunit [Acidobacteriia bacterium]|nr:efflux RND transporter periplasmic adaptor subunit [Terriglobia bacterium]
MAALLLASCGKDEPQRAEAAGVPTKVLTVAVAAQEWPAVYEATGAVRARTAATISAKVMGYVRDVKVQVGDHVTAGQTLITLDARDLEANVRRAEAGRSEVQSAIPEADNGVAAARANLDLAQATFNRMQDLASKKSISNQEFDEATARLKSAQASFEMARAKRSQLDSKMAQVEQEVSAAGIMRDYATITAPFAGVVTAKSVDPGNLSAPGAPLLTIEQAGGYRLEAQVDESKIGVIRIGQPVEVALDALDRTLTARVSEIVPAVDAASRAYVVKIDLPAAPQFRSGMFGRALFSIGRRTVLAAPPAALVERGQLQSVFVAEDGTARMRLVTVGQRHQDAVEVLSGLSAGERVVSPIPAGLQDGTKLEVRQ